MVTGETLGSLRYHWDTAYRISRRGRFFIAYRLDGLGSLTGQSPDELLMMIRADYGDHPVPRR